MRHSSGFRWDATTKKFTAPEEVWEDYFKSAETKIKPERERERERERFYRSLTSFGYLRLDGRLLTEEFGSCFSFSCGFEVEG
ncbi:hypothetical protein QYF36_008489 [Acer negundo]|nr:hypothetical protein QYF36_008489 [Acer negundo]